MWSLVVILFKKDPPQAVEFLKRIDLLELDFIQESVNYLMELFNLAFALAAPDLGMLDPYAEPAKRVLKLFGYVLSSIVKTIPMSG